MYIKVKNNSTNIKLVYSYIGARYLDLMSSHESMVVNTQNYKCIKLRNKAKKVQNHN
jgi:hypothetical protein